MNAVKILVLEESGNLDVVLKKVLKGVDYEHVIKIDAISKLNAVLTKELPDMAFVEYAFLEKNKKENLLERFELLKIPCVCLFPSGHFNGNIAGEDIDKPYAVLGERFSDKALKNFIDNALFIRKKDEYFKLKKQMLVDDHIFVKMGSQLEKINTSEILYVSSDGNYSMVQTVERKYAVKLSLKKMLEGLPNESFARIHRGYIVQIGKIAKVNIANNQIFVGEQPIPIGRYYKSAVLSRLNKIG